MKVAKRFNKLERLDALTKIWGDCLACELGKTRNRLVHWRGSPDAPLFLIGEGPGGDEDEQGMPFVGMAGRRLDELLKLAGISPNEDVFIANLVACRPPQNRVPSPAEVKECRPRLEAMMGIVAPKALLLLGGTAALRIAGITQISRWRGEKVDVEILAYNGSVIELPAVPTYHPSYLNRMGNKPELRQQMIKDIELAWRLANEE